MRKFSLLVVLALVIAAPGYTQSTSLTLPTTDNTSSFNVNNSSATSLLKVNGAGKVGIGQTEPRAQLEVGGLNGILSTGAFGTGDALTPGAGARLHWYPKKAAFRAGVAEGAYWDDSNIGNYSIALGYQNRATGENALALGSNSQASGSYAIAIGAGQYGYAIASGPYSIAIGGETNTNNREGAMVIGDHSYFNTTYASSANQLTMRFTGGFRLWTSSPDSARGVYMRPNTSGWSNYSDRNKKENFEIIDLEKHLEQIKKAPVTKWNYKGCDQTIKYMGPMAQDFYAAFQLGGDDSLGINSICLEGVTLAGVQALIKRTDDLKTAQQALHTAQQQLKLQTDKVAQLETSLFEQNQKISELEKALSAQNVQIAKQQTSIENITNKFNEIESKLNLFVNNSELTYINSTPTKME